MSTTEIIGKHDVLCSSLNFATPEGTAECDCNLSIMADMLEALEALPLAAFDKDYSTIDAAEFVDASAEFLDAMAKARAAIRKAKGGAA